MLVFSLRNIQLVSLCVLLGATGLQGAEDSEIEFRDKHEWGFGRPPVGTWTENEKAIVLDAFKKAKRLAPGVVARATAYRPVRTYRARKQQGYVLGHADTELNAMYLTDLQFEERNHDDMPGTIIHECVHLIHGSVGRNDEEWARLVDQSIAAVRKRVTDSGSKYFWLDSGSSAQTTPRELRGLPAEYGLPPVYACTNLNECLAACVEKAALGKYDAPANIKAYLQQNYLSLPYEPTVSLRRIHEAMELYTTAKSGETSKYDEAIKILTELIESHPNPPHLLTLRGRAHLKKKDNGQALQDYIQAARLYQHSPFESYNLQLNIGDLHGLTWGSKESLDEALTSYGRAIAIQPRNSLAFARRGQVLSSFTLKRYDEAIADYSEAISRAPDADAYYVSRALVKKTMGNYKSAIEDFDVVLDKYKDAYRHSEHEALVGRAECRVAIEEYAGADDDLTAANELWPAPMLSVLEQRFDVRMKAKRYDKAVEDLDFLIKVTPKNIQYRFKRGFALWYQGKRDEAVAAFDELIGLMPNETVGYFARGQAYFEVKDFELAIADFSKSVDLEAKNISARLARSRAYAELHQYDEALTDLDESLKVNPKLAEAYYRRAMLRATCPAADYRDGPKAIADANKLLELQGDGGLQRSVMAAAQAENGDFEAAVSWQKRALELVPESLREAEQAKLALYEKGKPFHDSFEQ